MTARRPLVVVAAAALALLAACGGDDGDAAPSTLIPPGSTAVSTTTVPAVTTTTFAPTTAPAPTVSPSQLPGTGATIGPGVTVPSLTTAPDASCPSQEGPLVTIEIVEPMPLPFCIRVRTDQALRVVNRSTTDTAFNIYRGALEDLFQTPELPTGAEWSSEKIGDQFVAGPWSLEVDQLPDWVGTMIVVG